MKKVGNWHHDGTVHLADMPVQLVYVLRLPRTPHKRTVHGWQLDSHVLCQCSRPRLRGIVWIRRH
eukprot:7033196-Pyramimonas_sp.AAC.1